MFKKIRWAMSLGMLTLSFPAAAQTYELSIRQVEPRGEYETITCDQTRNPCFVSIPIKRRPRIEYLDVTSSFIDGKLFFTFEGRNFGRLFLAGYEEKDEPYSMDIKEGSQTIELLRSHSKNQNAFRTQAVYRQPVKLTKIEITITPAP